MCIAASTCLVTKTLSRRHRLGLKNESVLQCVCVCVCVCQETFVMSSVTSEPRRSLGQLPPVGSTFTRAKRAS